MPAAKTEIRSPAYPFNREDAIRANEEWGANCGPGALAVCLGISLDALRPNLQSCGFEAKRYMSPTMMMQAIRDCGAIVARNSPRDVLPFAGLARIQWHGPWTAPGANPRWAYRHTHWICSLRFNGDWWVFDINGGWRTLEEWKRDIVPLILQEIPRNNGEWSVTHHWEVRPA